MITVVSPLSALDITTFLFRTKLFKALHSSVVILHSPWTTDKFLMSYLIEVKQQFSNLDALQVMLYVYLSIYLSFNVCKSLSRSGTFLDV